MQGAMSVQWVGVWVSDWREQGINKLVMSRGESTIKTYVRIRPPATNCVFGEGGTLTCCDRIHHFDHVFPAEASDEQIFERVGSELVENTLRGLNSTLFAYGQTGTGKTYTMTGNSMREGLVQRTVALLLRRLVNAPRMQAHSLRLNYIEIYNQSVRDLLAEREGRVAVREAAKNGFYVEGVEAVEVRDAQEFNSQLQRGLLKRSVKSTKMNEVSSRSHTILTVLLEAKVGVEEGGGGWVLRESKLNFVDLAGSQKQKQTDVSGSKLKEASSINKSLTTLSLVISKLADKTSKAAHVPYRESVLTKLLKDSIGGNSVTAFIGTISGQKTWIAETLSTLLFLERLKSVKNVVEVNEKVQGKEEELQRVITAQQQRISELEHKLAQSQQKEEDVKAHMQHLQAELEHVQLQVRELEERLLEQDPLPSFFSHFQQEEPHSPSFFDADSQQEEGDEGEGEEKELSVIHEAVAESEDPKEKQQLQAAQEKVRFQTEVKSRRQAASSQRMSTASGKARRGGKSLWQMESQFLREEVRRYAQDEKVYCDFVQLISEHMGNFQFAAAQILILRAQAERLNRTEAHLHSYRAKLAQLTALVDIRPTHSRHAHSHLEQTRSHFGTASNCSQGVFEEKQLVLELERARREAEEGVRVRGEMEEEHRVELFRVQEQLLGEQEDHQKTSDQLQFLRDENSRLAHINQLYQQELTATTSSDTHSSSEEKEMQQLRQKVADLQDIIQNDFVTAIQELQLEIKAKTESITATSQENQALREHICLLEAAIDELRLRCSQLQAAQAHQCLPEAHTLLAAQYDALCLESQMDKFLLRQVQAEAEQVREEVRAIQQRLRSEEESHRQAQTYFRYELKVRRAEASKMKEEWVRASTDRDLSAKQHYEASQTLAALQQEITNLTARIDEVGVQLQETRVLKVKAEGLAAAEGARVHECVCSLLRAQQHYRSEERRFSRFKDKCQRELEALREQNRQLQQNTPK